MSGAPENVSSSRNMTSGQGSRIHVSMSVRGTRIALNQFARPMWAAARPTLAATTAAPRSVCWYRYRTFWTTSRLMKERQNWKKLCTIGCCFACGQAAGYTGNRRSLLLEIKVAKVCSSCVHAGNDVDWAMRVACSAVAVPEDEGNQSNAKAITSNAPLGVIVRHFLNTHAIP